MAAPAAAASSLQVAALVAELDVTRPPLLGLLQRLSTLQVQPGPWVTSLLDNAAAVSVSASLVASVDVHVQPLLAALKFIGSCTVPATACFHYEHVFRAWTTTHQACTACGSHIRLLKRHPRWLFLVRYGFEPAATVSAILNHFIHSQVTRVPGPQADSVILQLVYSLAPLVRVVLADPVDNDSLHRRIQATLDLVLAYVPQLPFEKCPGFERGLFERWMSAMDVQLLFDAAQPLNADACEQQTVREFSRHHAPIRTALNGRWLKQPIQAMKVIAAIDSVIQQRRATWHAKATQHAERIRVDYFHHLALAVNNLSGASQQWHRFQTLLAHELNAAIWTRDAVHNELLMARRREQTRVVAPVANLAYVGAILNQGRWRQSPQTPEDVELESVQPRRGGISTDAVGVVLAMLMRDHRTAKQVAEGKPSLARTMAQSVGAGNTKVDSIRLAKGVRDAREKAAAATPPNPRVRRHPDDADQDDESSKSQKQ